jgi:hypothetical protein
MKTVFCPLCKAAIQLIYKNESLADWRFCKKCDQPSYVIVDNERLLVRPLKELVGGAAGRKQAIETLAYVLKKKNPDLEDLTFVVGKRVTDYIDYFMKTHILDQKDDTYHIKPSLEKYVARELQELMPDADWIADLVE